MNYSKVILTCMLMLFISGQAMAQQPAVKNDASWKYRKIFTISGAGGGFAVGTFVGLAKFDDAVNSDKKVWTTAILGGAGGAVGGYFLGRMLDRSRDRANQPGQRTVQLSPILSTETRGFHMSYSF